MNRKRSRFVIGLMGASAMVTLLLWKYGQRVRQRANQKESIARWEDEGGNVSDSSSAMD
ncbi:MAG TPA: hypothetical protein VFW00_01600 [Rhodocyclaceae bacterium]|nr:hypothetical protein [Rhodocyclaceae bacterium]